MNAQHAITDEKSSKAEGDSAGVMWSKVATKAIRRRARRRFLERLEQTLFMGILLTLILFTAYIGLVHYTGTSTAASTDKISEGGEDVAGIDWALEERIAEELRNEEPISPIGSLEEVEYPEIGEDFSIQTSWIEQDEVDLSSQMNPYLEAYGGVAEEASSLEDSSAVTLGSLEAVPAPVPVYGKMEVVPLMAQDMGEGKRHGILRVGGDHAWDLKRVYSSANVVWGLE
ncbi:MAG: hypothetical protein ACI8T1_000059 [Verrucomicrobiales bacterium]|jgi:hypothetical protein